MTDRPELAAALAQASVLDALDSRLLGEVRHGLEQLADEGAGAGPTEPDSHPDLAIRRRTW